MSDTKTLVTNLLNICKPSKDLAAKQEQKAVIKRPAADETIIITQYNAKLACIAVPQAPKDAPYQGETYHPVTEELQERAGSACKGMMFHLCVSVTGGLFLLPQKLHGDNSWNKSMEAVIEAGRKGPIKVSSNQELNQYQVEICDAELADNTTEKDLEELCNKAFSDLIISQPDHPVLCKLLGTSDIYGGF